MEKREIISGPGVTSGPETKAESIATPEIKGITERDLRVVLPPIGETTFVLQRNAKDERNPESLNYGKLTPEAVEETRNAAKKYFEQLLSGLSPEERKGVEIIIVASDATLIAPEGREYDSSHKRALETAAEVMRGTREALEELGLSENQIINHALPAIRARAEEDSRDIAEFKELEPLKILREAPEFVQYLKDKYGVGKEFWVAYEQDIEKAKREELGAEGVEDIAERMRRFVKLLARYGRMMHSRQKDRRLIIWAVSHYDSISPFIKGTVLKKPTTDYLPINAGGGITLEIDKEGKAKTEISDQKFDVKL